MSKLEIRSANLRADAEEGTVSGIAVPWDTPVELFSGYVEIIARGAVVAFDDIKLYWQHETPIGRVFEAEDRDAGLFIRARISDTAQGRDALTLLRDGVVNKFSIGFEPDEESVEHAENGDITVTRTKIALREVSVVSFPAYKDAQVTEVRNETASQVREGNNKKETPMETASKADLLEVRTLIEDLDRKVQNIPTHTDSAPSLDTRSAGEVLKAIVSGDQSTIDQYERLQREYVPNTTAATINKPGWVGNLTRIFDASSGVLAQIFSTGNLPSTGTTVEYAQLKTNTIDVNAQSAENAAIAMGNVELETKTANVVTYAGGTTLSRQTIERSTVGVLNTSLEALATAAGARKKVVLRAAFDALVTARRAVAADAGVVVLGGSGVKLSVSDAQDWEDAIIDAAIKYEALALPMDALVVNALVFKALRNLTVSGERVFQTWKDNASGELNLPGLKGQMAGLPVYLDSGVANTAAHAVFVNGRAIRQYESGLVSLSDETILTLSKSFAVYKYGAIASEIPAAVVPVKIAAE